MKKSIYLAAGCFWCTESVFKVVIGVSDVLPGFTGGFIKNPPYREVCTGRTGHAEAIALTYDDEQINLKELLLIFFNTHDPTTLNRQGHDVGTHYRSAIFYTEESQKEVAKELMQQLEDEGVFSKPIVTELVEATPFYPAEEEHLDFYNKNPDQPYCHYVINPKLEKLKRYYSNYITI